MKTRIKNDKKIETNIKVKESDFKFDSKKYSDVEIIDFR